MDLIEKHQIPGEMNIDSPEAQCHHPLLRPLKAGPLMILVFMASTNSLTVGLLFEPPCK
jgi:hypothetical protein